MFGINKKTKENISQKNKALIEKDIIDSIDQNKHLDEAIIKYILLLSIENKIQLAYRKDGAVYMNIDSEKITNFLKDWFHLLKLRLSNRLSQEAYDMFIMSYISTTDNSVKKADEEENQQKSDNSDDNNYDDFLSIFENN